MRFRPIHAALGVFAALVPAAPAAHAFTMENTESSYAAPRFDLGEQSKQFRKDGADSPSAGKRDFTTPLGTGTFEFGVRQGSDFGSGFGQSGSSFGSSQNYRSHFEHVLTPENLR